MTDLFHEIDEDIRRDKLARFWKRYGNLIIGVLLLALIAVGGWRYYEYMQRQNAQAMGARFEAALKLSRAGEGANAERDLAAIASEASGGYRLIARFRGAAEIAKRDAGEGAAAFEALAADNSVDPIFRDLARIRAGFIRVDTLDYAAFRPTLEPLASGNGAFRHSARELLGLSALKAGNMDEAGRWFDQIAADRETPPSLRQRADLFLALVRGGAVEERP